MKTKAFQIVSVLMLIILLLVLGTAVAGRSLNPAWPNNIQPRAGWWTWTGT